MKLVDSHSHLFLEEFDADLPLVIERARQTGVTHIFMPNIDSTTITPMLKVSDTYKGYCYPMIGLHPTSVNADFHNELAIIEKQLNDSPNRFVAIGEIGLDLYWDKTFLNEQLNVFDRQIQWALAYDLPVVIHCREAFEYIYKALLPYKGTKLRGIFHSFTGSQKEAELILDYPGFSIGINGVVTFKKSTLPSVLPHIPLNRIVLETDAPYLAPAPNRGKRNESAFIKDTLTKVAEVYGQAPEIVAETTSENALKVFGMSL